MALIAMKSVPGHPPGNLGNTGCPGLPVEGIGANYLAFIELASIRIWLRANQSAPWRSVSSVMPGLSRASTSCLRR
jgi:hypothetical protein